MLSDCRAICTIIESCHIVDSELTLHFLTLSGLNFLLGLGQFFFFLFKNKKKNVTMCLFHFVTLHHNIGNDKYYLYTSLEREMVAEIKISVAC